MPVTINDYVSWTIQDLVVLTKSVITPDSELPNLPTIVVDRGENVSEMKISPEASAEEKRARMVEAAMPRFKKIYNIALNKMVSVPGGMNTVADKFFKALDEVFKADATKPEKESITDYLRRKILNPINKLMGIDQFKSESVLARAKYLYELVEQKALAA